METVPEYPELEVGADKKGKKVAMVAQNIAFGIIAAMMVIGAPSGSSPATTSCTPRCGS